MNENRYKYIFDEILSKSDDGFIVVDKDGIITDINEPYCNFLGKEKKNILGENIKKVISNTSMLEVIRLAHRGDDDYIQKYLEGETKEDSDRYAIANRFCVFDENNEVVAAVAQMKFRQKTLDFAQRIFNEEFEFYKEEYKNIHSKICSFDEIIGNSPNFITLKKRGKKAAKTLFPVLLTGETGTGKEVFAKAIHFDSSRNDKPIISINCAAIPSELLESELFGYEEGSFTGAKKGGKKGKFQLADGGTIFLDEIGDMPLNMQAKLLRVLQEKEIEKIGSYAPVPIDIRIIAATRQNLLSMIHEGTFREDLYYRLNVINLEMIPLREHRDDVLIFANYFLNKLNTEYKTSIILSNDVKRCLKNYPWPGNVRELNNVIKSAYASCDDFIIELSNLPSKMVSLNNVATLVEGKNKKLKNMVNDFEASIIKDVLKRCNWNIQAAAMDLGIERSLLYKKMKRLGIEVKKTIS